MIEGPIGARKTSCARDRVSLMRIASDLAALPLPQVVHSTSSFPHNGREQIVAALEILLVLPVFIFLSISLVWRLVGRVLGRERARHCYIDGQSFAITPVLDPGRRPGAEPKMPCFSSTGESMP